MNRSSFGAALLVLLISMAAALARPLAAAPKGGARVQVSIENLQFKPSSVSVHPGDTVAWTNNDDRDHTVVARDGSFKSGNIGTGQSFEHRFEQAGTFAYSCSYHPRMHGEVVVAPK